MERIIERFLLPLFVIMSILYVLNSFGKDNELKKIFHHTTNQPVHLEVATLSLYFSHDIDMQESAEQFVTKNNTIGKKFFFPRAIINADECREMIKRINTHAGLYTISIQELKDHNKGIMISLSFDTQKISLSYETFDSIGLQKGIVFRFYNKELLTKLEQKNNEPILRTLWHHKKPRIAIDPGHGGFDSGAIGYKSIKEKDICLAISTLVKDLLQNQGYDVMVTRDNDYNKRLDERTQIANNNKVDFFVSIHANHANNIQTSGIETFFLQPKLFKDSTFFLTEKEKEIACTVLHKKSEYAHNLAQSIQSYVCQSVNQYHQKSIDRKVKSSITQVLLGTQMPAILIEVGFLSNSHEAELLNSLNYQKRIAHGICNGIAAITLS